MGFAVLDLQGLLQTPSLTVYRIGNYRRVFSFEGSPLLDSPFPLVSYTRCHHPLIWISDFASFVSSLGLYRGQSCFFEADCYSNSPAGPRG
jgi:hypothetical protein